MMNKTTYTTPSLWVEEVKVENGFIGSYGDDGQPGQDSGYNDYEGDL